MKPDFKTFKSLAARHGLVPTYVELPCDTETPVTVYAKISGEPYSALLESVEGGEKFARYSFISVSHHTRFECSGDSVTIEEGEKSSKIKSKTPLEELKKLFKKLNPATLSDIPRFCGGAVGFASYDMVRNFEFLPERLPKNPMTPDALFLLTDECVIFDHWKHKLILIKWNLVSKNGGSAKTLYIKAEKSLSALRARLKKPAALQPFEPLAGGEASSSGMCSNLDKSQYKSMVLKAKGYIRSGDVIQTVMSQRFETETNCDAFELYRALRIVNPSPYLFLLKMKGFSLVGSSPEILVRKTGDRALTCPIAGTRKRGKTEQEDLALEKELLKDPKERAEHIMLVDLGRNDLGRCCEPGTVKVPEFMKVERFSHVMHIVSTVEGKLKRGEDSFSLFQACFPAGTVTGAPKIRSMQIIEELENTRRGTYAGSVGYFGYSGNMDMAITIRTILMKGKKLYVQAGAGIVADSDPAREEQETRNKAAALFRAVEIAKQGFRS